MHEFDPRLSLKENYLKSDDIAFASWEFAGHNHREEFRESGRSPARTAWLQSERIVKLKLALANRLVLALGIASDDQNLEIAQIPENLFVSDSAKLDGENSRISGGGRQFVDVRICLGNPGTVPPSRTSESVGRPNQLPLVLEAWKALKAEEPDFLEWDKTSQNRVLREKVAELFPGKFPGNSRIGESTIRRHRRDHPDRFI